MNLSSLRLVALLFLLSVSAPWGCDDSGGKTTPTDLTSDDVGTTEGLTADLSEPDVAAETDETQLEDLVADQPPEVELIPLPDKPWDFTQKGPYNVGYYETSLTYQPEGVTGSRELRLAFWYPTRAAHGFSISYLNLLARPNVWHEPIPAPEGPFPLLLFSHGSNGFAEQSYFMTEYFASHGFVVAAPDHTGNTFNDLGGGVPPETMFLRPQDASAVLDAIEALPAEHLLHGLVGDTIAMSGHSFGGYTSLAAAGANYPVDTFLAECANNLWPAFVCQSLAASQDIFRAGFLDPRIDLIIPQAPGGTMAFGSAGAAAIDVPVLLFTGARDATTPNATEGDPTWAALDGPGDLRVDFATAGHFTFSNACALAPAIGENDGCGVGFVDLEEAYRTINAFSMAFIQRHLFGDDSGADILDGTRLLSNDITLSKK